MEKQMTFIDGSLTKCPTPPVTPPLWWRDSRGRVQNKCDIRDAEFARVIADLYREHLGATAEYRSARGPWPRIEKLYPMVTGG